MVAASSGQIVSFSAEIPDMHYLAGSRAGRIHPLWRGPDGTGNTEEATIAYLSGVFSRPVSSLDLLAYVAAVAAHPGFTDTFRPDLADAKTLRVPLTKTPDLFWRAAELGRRILYLSTFGRRCPPSDTPPGPPRAPEGPYLETAVPAAAVSLDHDDSTSTLTIIGYTPSRAPGGNAENREERGVIRNVSADVYNYSTATMNVVESWFGYRKLDPTGENASRLDRIVPSAWQSQYTSDLIDLLNVLTLLVSERLNQQRLLEDILDGPQIARSDMQAADALPNLTGTNAKPPAHKRAPQQPELQ